MTETAAPHHAAFTEQKDPKHPMEKWIRQDTRYSGVIVQLKTGDVTLDNGAIAFREVVEHPGGVGVVPFDGRHVYLVRQFRIAVNDWVLEIPAGKMEPGDAPEARGLAEVQEEIGHTVARTVDGGRFYATVGYCNELIHLYFAFGLTHTGQQLEPEERIEIVPLPLDEIRRRLADYSINDGKTIVALHRLLAYLEEHPEEIRQP
ncbi:MAG: NUDIX hydrolase [Candidatus Hydrogenedentes bacterium]|nr:NUDIX hydrolase [Candidatus Hydrogenedentota bacterium]